MNSFFLILILFLIILEILFRFLCLRYCPLYIRIFHCLGLLSKNKFQEWRTLSQRIHRSGLGSYKKLLLHYSKISGLKIDVLKKICDGSKPWNIKKRKTYSSGIHGLIEQELKLPVGLYPKSNQRLKSLSINQKGRRVTESNSCFKNDKKTKTENVVLIGGSCVFGVGSTDNSKTLCSRLEYYLNNQSPNKDKHFNVINCGFLGYSSYQEMLILSLLEEDIDHIIVLDGWNELDQYQDGSKLSSIMNGLSLMDKDNLLIKIMKSTLGQLEIIKLARRVFSLMKSTDYRTEFIKSQDISNIYPHF